jgi:TonB family protein
MRAAAALATPVIRLDPSADAAFVQAIYHDVVIASRCLIAGNDNQFLVGDGAGVDAPLPSDRVVAGAHPLVSADERGFRVAVAEGMTGEVIFEDRVASLVTLAAGGQDIVLDSKSHLRIGCGAMAFLVAASTAPPALPRPRPRPQDRWPVIGAAAGLALVALLLAIMPPGRKTLSYDPEGQSILLTPFQTIPPVPLPAPATHGFHDAAPGARPAAPASGARRAQHPAAAQPRSAPRPPDREDAGRQGILGAILSHPGASWQSIFTRQGDLAEGAPEILRGLQAGDLTGATSVGGLQPIGTGAWGPGGNRLTGIPLGIGNGLGPCVGCNGVAGDRIARLGPRRHVAIDIIPGQDYVRGSLDKEIVRRVIHRHLNEIKYCYERELVRRPSLLGRVVTQFSILPTGRVAAAALASSTVGNTAVESCILAAVRRWEFPAPLGGGLAMVSYPFVLVPTDAP